MLVPVPLIASQISAYSPRRSSPLTARRTGVTSPSTSRQSISTRRSSSPDSVRRLGQSLRWIDATPLRDVADDGVAGHRLAALPEPHHQPCHAMDLDAPAD